MKVAINQSVKGENTPQPGAGALVFSAAAQKKIKTILSRYPKEQSQSAVIPVLWLAQQEFGGWLSVDAMELVASTLNMPYIRVYEVATFYTMFNLQPVGKYHVQVCTNCSCMVRGAYEVLKEIQEFTGVSDNKGTSSDGLFTVEEVECLGACVNAPMMQINTHYYTDLTKDSAVELLNQLKQGKAPAPNTAPAAKDPVTGGKYAEVT